jgi:hypothetical protein
MLDFLLVLGQIPGTNFQVSFEELITIYLAVGLAWYVHHRRWTVADAQRAARLTRLYVSTKKGTQLKLSI